MYTPLSTYETFKNFSKIELANFTNIPMQIGTGDGELKPKPEYARYIDVDHKPWLVIEESRRIAQEILHPELNHEIWKLHKKTLDELWEVKKHSVYWSRNIDGDKTHYNYTDEDGEDCSEFYDHFVEPAHVHKRNDTIFNYRCPFLRDYKTGGGNLENKGYYGYKSKEHKKQFLEEVEQKGLVRIAEVKQPRTEIYDPDGFYHKVSLPATKIKTPGPINQKDIVEPNNEFYNEETGDYEILREDEL